MAYNTVTSATNTASQTTPPPVNVITILQEKEFALKQLFKGDTDSFNFVNTLMNIYEDNDSSIPLTSIIYTPNRRFFENSKFFKNITANKTLGWLKKHNVLVIVYDVTANLDNTLHSQNTYSDASLIMDIIQTSACLSSFQSCIPTIFKNENDTLANNEEMINLMRFEASPFNHRLSAIRDRLKNVYSYNFTNVNCLVFNDLNNDVCISKFLKNTININLMN